MERNRKRNGLINLLALLAAGGVALAVGRYANLPAATVAAAMLGLGVLVAALTWFQMGLEERERLERMEFDEASRGKDAGLFNVAESETFPAKRSREQFERYFVPGFTVGLLLLEAAGAWALWRWLDRQPAAAAPNQPLVAMAILGLVALILFILGRYAANLARLEKSRLLGPGANWLLLGAYLLALSVLGIIATLAEFLRIEGILARVFCGMLGLLAVENLLALLLEIYRPRVKGKPGRLLYDSRLVGLLGHPEDVLTTAAHTLDYQFGFKVSETWFYKFLEKAFVWLVLAQIGLLWLSSCFVVITAGEEGLLERFGRPAGDGVLAPGLHTKLPWPIDRVHRFRKQAVQTFEIGTAIKEATTDDRGSHAPGAAEEHHEDNVILWSVAHAHEKVFNMLVASREIATTNVPQPGETRRIPPVNELTVRIPVQYEITNLRDWAYKHQNPGPLLQRVGAREAANFLASADLTEVLSTRRIEAGEELGRRLQRRADELELGVKILFVGFFHTHPPVEVAASFEAAVGAQQRREAEILKAEAHKTRTNLLAQAEAVRRERAAEAERERRVAAANATAGTFTNQIAAWRASPGVYAQRAYLQALTEGAAGARKYILAVTNSEDIVILNLEEKVRPDILDVPLPAKAPQ